MVRRSPNENGSERIGELAKGLAECESDVSDLWPHFGVVWWLADCPIGGGWNFFAGYGVLKRLLKVKKQCLSSRISLTPPFFGIELRVSGKRNFHGEVSQAQPAYVVVNQD